MSELTAVETARITHVLPALTYASPPASVELHVADANTMALSFNRSAAREPAPHLSVSLGGGDTLAIWDDRVVAARTVFPFDESFGARLVPDPRAPLTVDPPLALALLAQGTYWAVFVPPREEDALRALYAIRDACRQRGIEPMGMDESLDDPVPPMRPSARQRPVARTGYSAPAPHLAGFGARFNETESVLLAIAHLSLLFLPVLLAATIWQALRQSNPPVAQQAKEAAAFQGIFCAVVLPVLGYALAAAHAQGFVLASALGLTGFFVILLAAATCAFAAAVQSLRGQGFSYGGLLQRMRDAALWSA